MKKIRFKVQLVVFSDEEHTSESHEVSREELIELAVLDKDYQRVEQLGLKVSESKEILKSLQKHILQRQEAAFVETKRQCQECGRPLHKHSLESISGACQTHGVAISRLG